MRFPKRLPGALFAASLAVVIFAAVAAHAANGPSASGANPQVRTSEVARYRFHGPSPWRDVRAVENPGYRLSLSTPDGEVLEATVEVDGSPLPDRVPFPVEVSRYPPELRSLLSAGERNEEIERQSEFLTRGATTALEAIERIIAFTSRRVTYEPPTGVPETAARCLSLRQGSCVGRSLLAEALLLAAGIPARQVTGILTAAVADELADGTREFFSDAISGVRHRWMEAYVPGLGWVPSDPGGLANTVTSRYLALARAPDPAFAVTILARSADLARPRLSTIGRGVTLARPRVGNSRSGRPAVEAGVPIPPAGSPPRLGEPVEGRKAR